MPVRYILISMVLYIQPLWAEDASEPLVVTGKKTTPQDREDATLLMDRIDVTSDPRIRHGWGDLLDRSLGARVQRSGSPGRREVLQLRGAGSHQTAVYLEGVQLTGPRGGQFDLSTVVSPCIESIDVLRGSAGAAYGSGAQGGVLRLNPKSSQHPLKLELSGGAFHYLQGSVCGGVGDPSAYINLTLQHDQAEGDFEYTDINNRKRVRENNDHSRHALLMNGALKETQFGEVSFVFSGHIMDRGEPGSSQFPTVDARSDEHRLALGLSWMPKHSFSQRFPISMSAHWTQRAYEFEDPDPIFVTDASRFTLEDQGGSLEAKISWSGSGWFVPALTLQGGRHSAVTDAPNRDNRSEIRSTGSMVSQMDFFPHSSLTINWLNRLDARSGRDPVWLPKVGVLWQENRVWSWGASAGSHFRDPSFDELYFQGSGISGNPDLKPESGWTADSQLTYHPPSMPWTLNAAAYHQEFDRLILFVPLDAYRIQASDRQSATLSGLEARFKMEWSSISWETNYHYQRTRDGDSQPLPFRPAHRVNQRLEWSKPFGRIYGGMMTQSEVYSDTYGRRKLSGYTLFDLGVLLELPGGFQLGTDLRNLFDRTQVFDSIHQPLPGRSVYAVLRWRDNTR